MKWDEKLYAEIEEVLARYEHEMRGRWGFSARTPGVAESVGGVVDVPKEDRPAFGLLMWHHTPDAPEHPTRRWYRNVLIDDDQVICQELWAALNRAVAFAATVRKGEKLPFCPTHGFICPDDPTPPQNVPGKDGGTA